MVFDRDCCGGTEVIRFGGRVLSRIGHAGGDSTEEVQEQKRSISVIAGGRASGQLEAAFTPSNIVPGRLAATVRGLEAILDDRRGRSVANTVRAVEKQGIRGRRVQWLL
jgi:hypothetical protein